MWSPLMRRHLFNNLLWSVFSAIIHFTHSKLQILNCVQLPFIKKSKDYSFTLLVKTTYNINMIITKTQKRGNKMKKDWVKEVPKYDWRLERLLHKETVDGFFLINSESVFCLFCFVIAFFFFLFLGDLDFVLDTF